MFLAKGRWSETRLDEEPDEDGEECEETVDSGIASERDQKRLSEILGAR